MLVLLREVIGSQIHPIMLSICYMCENALRISLVLGRDLWQALLVAVGVRVWLMLGFNSGERYSHR